MRFLLEFVSCCGSPTQRAPEPTVSAAEEEKSLVPATVATRRFFRKKQRRVGVDWRPSLGSISEDNAVPVGESESPRSGAVVSSAGRDVKKRSAGGGVSAVKFRHRSYSDGYYGPAALPNIMPAFSPTPFMF